MEDIYGISEMTLKNLSDKSIEKRKQASQEVIRVIEDLLQSKKEEEIKKRIHMFTVWT